MTPNDRRLLLNWKSLKKNRSIASGRRSQLAENTRRSKPNLGIVVVRPGTICILNRRERHYIILCFMALMRCYRRCWRLHFCRVSVRL
jgi:hypothetical protein